MCTFHSMCVRILKKEAQHLGLSEQFSIFDTDDQLSVAKSILKDLDLDPAQYKPSAVLSDISGFKSKGLSVEEVRQNQDDLHSTVLARFYERYEKALETNQALDFDDLLLKTVKLFKEHSDVLETYRRRFRYILVDEYQDTNAIQYQLIKFLAPGTQGITLTGDPDQSIYSWRGADIHNILNFQSDFPGAKIVKMEQNYRSKKHILELANQLVRHNTERYPKDALTQNPDGPLPILHTVYNAQNEAQLIASIILKKRSEGHSIKDIAVFYRTNQQSRSIEEALRAQGIPYTLIGGTKFFDRREIKDLIAYLRFIHNPADSISLMRIINLPTRGIGESLKAKIRDFADDNGLNCWQALMDPNFSAMLDKRSRMAIARFNQIVADCFALAYSKPDLLLKRIVESTDYEASLTVKGEVEEDRVENLHEFMAYVSEISQKNPQSNLGTLLEEISLVGEKKDPNEEDPDVVDMVTLMTLHSSKGLEFPIVLFAGLDEGLLPHQRSLDLATTTAIEEERRLCYVGITRAQDELHLFTARERHTFKGPMPFKVSRFVSEMQGQHMAISKNGVLLTQRQWTEPIGSVYKSQNEKPLRKGALVSHDRYGKGVVMELDGKGLHQQAKVFFDKAGSKTVLLEFEVLKII
jgi:DNA helicase II / ATP-dependent DNA helicase PcrA